jgi:hypothetical protein
MKYAWDEFLLIMIGQLAWPTAFIIGVCLLTQRLDAFCGKLPLKTNRDIKPIPPGVTGFNPTIGQRGKDWHHWKSH